MQNRLWKASWVALHARTRVALAVFAAGAGCAAPSVWALNLTQSYEAALRNDATIRAARAQAEASRERLPQAKSQLLPSISANASRNRNDLTTSTMSLGRPVTLENGYYSGSKSLSIRQPLYRPAQFAALDQARALTEDADAVLEYTEQNLVVRVGEAYFDALLATDQVGLIAAQKVSYTEQLKAAIKGFEAGTGTRTDVDEAQARLDLTIAQELEALQNRDLARRRLEVLTGEPVGELARLSPDLFQPEARKPQDVHDWILRAEGASPELQALRAQVDAAQAEIDKAEAGHKPTLDAVAQWSKTSSDSVTSINSRYDQKSIGLQLTVPLYAGGYVNSTVRQAVAAHVQAQERLEAARRDMGVRVHEQFRVLAEGVLKISALEQAVRSAEQAVMSNRKSFVAGSRTTLDVLNAEQQKTAALRDLAQARYNYLMAQVRLHGLAGNDRWKSITQANAYLVP
ncbi:channel protein TolC [Comamonas aquatica]|uniref:TolC family outer membrane protein n=1 Tax=Comamonas aquatica TaxID=225991 RepID=UPI000697B37A|nr:TolC family outer membrane protein [Comamonas aquatica]ANY61574.1 channel protein TolC [Comamonas aquatica]